MRQPRFIHLHTHSAYSLAEGAIKVDDLVALARKDGMPALAMTDTNNLFGAMEFASEASKKGIQPITGAQILAGPGEQELVLLVQNEEGYRNLCRLLSDAYLLGEANARAIVTYERLRLHAAGLICLTGGIKGPIAQALLHNDCEEAARLLIFLKEIFADRLFAELQRHGLPHEDKVEGALIDLAYAQNIPLVATNDCYFAARASYEAHDALLCIAEGRYVTEENRRRVTLEHYFKSQEEMTALFSDLPEALENTVVIAQRCAFLLQPIEPILPAFPTEAGRSEVEELRAQAREGLEWRLQSFVPGAQREDVAAPYRERLDYELGVIESMGYSGYFLIVSDFIRWAKAQNIPVGPGRGSGAGSITAWALRIIDLNPLAFGLLFERLLNPERVSLPDFDIDFCQDRRDEVIRYVQGKYGWDRVAQVITFGKLQARAVVRDVGRVLQIPYGQVDRIAKMIPNNPAHPMTLQEALDQDAELRAEAERDDTTKKLINIALQLEGLYRHASTHAAGVVIGDRPLHDLIPLYRDPRSDMPVTGFNMKYVEQAGLIKFDFLGLKTMTVIQKTMDMIAAGGTLIDPLQIPLDDEKTYALMASGNVVGIFQLESAGMRDVLRKMKPNRFEDIIALVALYRPGPMDNIPKYIAVKEGREKPDYLHPSLQPYLEETYGIMIYQEQVMQAAQTLAGYTLGAADLLRRAMGKKIKNEMDAQRERFIAGAKAHNGVPEWQASSIFDQIAKFAGYGFNKSHAAGYALIAYWTAWLKANHTQEFMAASMTYDMGNTDKLAIFKQDLERLGVKILAPDINYSYPVFAVENGAIRYALAALKGVGAQAMDSLVREREAGGPYRSLDDLASRLDQGQMNKRQFEHLAAAGAFDALNANRAQSVAAAELVLRHAQALAAERQSGQVSLFGGAASAPELGLPALPAATPWTLLEQLAHEFSAVGFYLSSHPLESRAQQFKNLGISAIAAVEADMLNKTGSRYQMAGVLLKKQEKISAKGNKYAFLQLSDPSGIFEVTLFSELLQASRAFLEPGRTLLLTVDAEQREDQLRFTAQKIENLDDSLEGKIRQIHVHLDAPEPARRLKEFLDAEGKGGAEIILFLALEDERTAEIRLPGRWALSAQARDILRSQPGVRDIREV